MPESKTPYLYISTTHPDSPPELAHGAALLQAVLESTEEGLLAIDEAERLYLHNRRFSMMWRLPLEQPPAQPGPELLVQVAAQLTEGELFLRQEKTLRHRNEIASNILHGKDGRVFSHFSRPLRHQGEIIGRVHAFADTTSQQLLAKALHQGQANLEKKVGERTAELKDTHHKLQQTEKMVAIGRLSASIAHELNNPLFGVINVLRGVQKRAALQPEDAKLVEMAIHEGLRMKELIMNLQHFNRPTSGMMVPTLLHRALDEMLLFCKKELENKKIAIAHDYDPELSPIQAVEDQLKQVILNLLNNAADACPRGGVIHISTRQAAKHIVFSIADTGSGIKPEDLPHIFEPFFTTKPAVKGTGLGLAVSYGIVKRHGGTIEVASTLGQGTTFTITLPLGGNTDG